MSMHYDDLELDKPLSLKMWGRMWPHISPHKTKLIVIAALMLICAAVDVAYSLALSIAVDHFIVPRSTEGLELYVAAMVALVLIQTTAVFIFFQLAIKIEVGFGKQLRQTVFAHLQKMSLSYYNTTPVGYILARVMSDTTRIGDVIAWSLVDLLWSICFIAGAFIAMFALNWQLALVVLAVVPLISVACIFIQKKVLAATRLARRQNSRISGAFNEGIAGARTSKTLVIEKSNEQEFEGLTKNMYRHSRKVAFLSAVFMPLVMLAGTLAIALVLGLGGNLVMFSGLAIGTLAAFFNFAIGLFDPIFLSARVYSEFVSSAANIERVCALLDRQPEITDPPEVVEKYGDNYNPRRENWEPLTGDIELRDVTFRYPDGTENVLERFNLAIPAGTYTAIVGETGAGKSTLVNLICRFFEPTSGEILIDGRDYRERSQLWLHSNIGYVLQHPHLFSGSVRENIRYGNLSASDEDIERAAGLVQADKVILRLENGMDTEVGEGGDRLSVGERQMISFARALLADPRILVLDEATSSVDTETEQLIKIATERILKGRTSFVIAHRLSTIKNADLILVVENGKIIERGTHRELLDRRGHYYQLYTLQFEILSHNQVLGAK